MQCLFYANLIIIGLDNVSFRTKLLNRAVNPILLVQQPKHPSSYPAPTLTHLSFFWVGRCQEG